MRIFSKESATGPGLGVLLLLAVLAGPRPAGARPDYPRPVTIGGAPHIPLEEIARYYGMDINLREDGTIDLAGRGRRFRLDPDGQFVVCRGARVYLQYPVALLNADWALHRDDWAFTLDPILQPGAGRPGFPARIIVIDPGHGGKDAGAVGPGGALEKDVVLDLALGLRNALQTQGLTAYLTREDDRFLELEERCRLAEGWKADLLISLHLNSVDQPDIKGVETYVLPGASRAEHFRRADARLGFAVQRGLLGRTGSVDRGLRRSRFAVLRAAPCPAILAECAFISNRAEEQMLLEPTYRAQLIEGLTAGILEYVRAAAWDQAAR